MEFYLEILMSHIKDEYRNPLDRRLAMMRRWHELCGKEATYLRLVEGLKKIQRKDLIEFILQLYKCKQSAESEVATMPNSYSSAGRC